MEARESVKLATRVLDPLRKIAIRDGLILARLLERLIESAVKAEKLK